MPKVELPERVDEDKREFYKGMFVAANVQRTDDGTPVFGDVNRYEVMDMMRQKRCQMCGHKIGAEAVCFPGAMGLWSYAEAPMHVDCCRYALQVCPMILRVKDRFGVAVCDSYDLIRGPECMPNWEDTPSWLRESLKLAHDYQDQDGRLVCTKCDHSMSDMGYLSYDEFMEWSDQ